MIKHLILLKIQNMMDIKGILLQWFLVFFDKKTSATPANNFAGSGIKNENISNKELAENLHRPVIRKFMKRKVYSSFMDNIWCADLADMHLIIKFKKVIRFFMCY